MTVSHYVAKVTMEEKEYYSAPNNSKFKMEKDMAVKGKVETTGIKALRRLPLSYYLQVIKALRVTTR